MQTVLFSVHSATLVSDTMKIYVRAICVAAGVCTHSYIDYGVNYESRVPTLRHVTLYRKYACANFVYESRSNMFEVVHHKLQIA